MLLTDSSRAWSRNGPQRVQPDPTWQESQPSGWGAHKVAPATGSLHELVGCSWSGLHLLDLNSTLFQKALWEFSPPRALGSPPNLKISFPSKHEKKRDKRVSLKSMFFSSVMKMDKETNVHKKWLGGAQTLINSASHSPG